jgi:hypothetical protein
MILLRISPKLDLRVMLRYQANDLERPMATFNLHISKAVLFNKMEFDLLYVKKNIRDFKSAITIEGEDTVINWTIGYMIAENVMLTVVYTKTFAYDENGVLVGQESTLIKTDLRF